MRDPESKSLTIHWFSLPIAKYAVEFTFHFGMLNVEKFESKSCRRWVSRNTVSGISFDFSLLDMITRSGRPQKIGCVFYIPVVCLCNAMNAKLMNMNNNSNAKYFRGKKTNSFIGRKCPFPRYKYSIILYGSSIVTPCKYHVPMPSPMEIVHARKHTTGFRVQQNRFRCFANNRKILLMKFNALFPHFVRWKAY